MCGEIINYQTSSLQTSTHNAISFHTITCDCPKINSYLTELWETDQISKRHLLTLEEKVEKNFEATHKGGQFTCYIVSLPIRDFTSLRESRIKLFVERNPKLHNDYCDEFKDIFDWISWLLLWQTLTLRPKDPFTYYPTSHHLFYMEPINFGN